MTPLQNPVLVGVIAAAQGIRGEVRIKPFTADPEALALYRVLHDRSGQRFEITAARTAKTMLVARIAGVDDRNRAEALRGTELFVERELLPDDDLEDDEFFQVDLEGLEARDADGRSWGVVTAVLDFGGGDLLELRKPGDKPVMIPFSRAAVPEIFIEAGWLRVDAQAAGLIDTDEEAPKKDDKPEPPA
ncbi:ribosome maturation factor RimM [Pseudohoeflea coraliihabitans]|uniref:Ribosome maturation factor RimM n=1 Tax=Pseudohoeflea coraliihabitans TaxID=2860393 RepID=A0ABS6WLD4_9HYPH|nr:ribosome maturation factor RimM [Pseudohoeflea sp. DP4N28-3]MBW3096769.1 ribosome maturation factor RimM [Pseudohoeflea sp. DP4N28-3]